MLTLSNKAFIFVSAKALIILGGFAIKTDSYETNQLFSTGLDARLILSNASFKKINKKIGDIFQYYVDNEEYHQRIEAILTNRNNKNKELIITTDPNHKKITIIKYKLNKVNL